MSASILDLETLAQPTEKILANLPPWSLEDAMSRLPKTHKKQETINAWIEEDKANHGKDAIEKAALNPETATIAIVGFYKEGRVQQLVNDYIPGVTFMDESGAIENSPVLYMQDERDLIEHAFLRLTEGGFQNADPVLGWNLHGMEIPMLVRRAWILGVKVPRAIFNPLSRYSVPDRFVDMMKVWSAGNYKATYFKLNNALKAASLPEKGDGKEFGKLWHEDRAKALEYSRNELCVQAQLYRRMGVDL